MSMLSLQQLASALGGEVYGNKRVRAPGPGHSPRDRSMSIKLTPDGYKVHSFAGDDWKECRDYIDGKIGAPQWEPTRSSFDRPIPSIFLRPSADGVTRLHPENVEYVYLDASGSNYLKVLRYYANGERKFKQFHWTGTAWGEGAPKGPKIPYMLPELLAAPDAPVLIVEGEKDANNVVELGDFTVTTNAGGSGNWSPDLNPYLRGRDVYILPDNDEAGEKHAARVYENLRGVAASIKVLRLPGLAKKGDVSDWIAAGGTLDGLVDLLKAAPRYEDSAKPLPLPWLNMSNWDNEPLPERKWSIRDRVPLNQAGLFSGEGGTGKSIVELMKNVAHVAAKDWLGSMPEPGPAFYLGAEDEADEIHIRLGAIAKHYGVTFKELVDGGLHVLPLLGEDATLVGVSRTGSVEVTPLYRRLYEAAGDIRPKNISIDTLSRAFSGNEIDRVQVYAFAMHMQALAKVAGGSVTVLSHPSLAGINNGSGISGSTAWHGAFRFRQYLKGAKAEDGEQPDNDLREFEFKKNQYGPKGESITLRYQHGLFLPEGGGSSLEKAARKLRAEEAFMALMVRFSLSGRNVSETKQANNYAPKAFVGEPEAHKHGLRKAELGQAMQDLFAAGKIRVETYGRYRRLAIGKGS